MSNDSWLKRNRDALTVGLLVALVGVASGLMWQAGSQSEAISNLRDGQTSLSAEIDAQTTELTAELKTEIADLVGNIDGLKAHTDKRFDGIEMRLDDIRLSIRADQADISKVIVSMGVVKEEDVFYAAVIDDNVWLFPSAKLAASFDRRGYKREQVSHYLYGIKIMSASAIKYE